MRALWPGLVRLARCVTHSEADAEDAAAQAVLNCYRRLASLRREDAFDRMADAGLPQRSAQHLRRRKRTELRGDWPDLPAGGGAEAGADAASDASAGKGARAAELMYFENYPLEEIAAVLGVPRGTAASRLSRGRRRLRAIIEEEGLS